VENLTEDFLGIVLNETPLLDVRAPVEFEKGAFKNAVNIPIPLRSGSKRQALRSRVSKEATKLFATTSSTSLSTYRLKYKHLS